VAGPTKPIINRGFVTVPDTPGLGVELNEPAAKEHLRYPEYFLPGTMFDRYIVGPIVNNGPYRHLDDDGKLVNTQ
jgi:hypothetical protein